MGQGFAQPPPGQFVHNPSVKNNITVNDIKRTIPNNKD
jgi:hypothetical protein